MFLIPSEEEGPKRYSDVEWEKLLPDVKKAAQTLGYTSELWEKDGETEYDEYDWDELPKDVKAAAVILGYDEDSWDE